MKKNKFLIATLFIGTILLIYYTLNITVPTKESMFQQINLKTNLLSLTIIGVPIIIILASIFFKKTNGILIAFITAYFIITISTIYYLNDMGIQLFNPLIYIMMMLLPSFTLIIGIIINNKNIKNAIIMLNILNFIFIASNIIILMTQNNSKILLTHLIINLIVACLLVVNSIVGYFAKRSIALISTISSLVILIIYLKASHTFDNVNREMFYNISLYLYPYLIYISYFKQKNQNI